MSLLQASLGLQISKDNQNVVFLGLTLRGVGRLTNIQVDKSGRYLWTPKWWCKYRLYNINVYIVVRI